MSYKFVSIFYSLIFSIYSTISAVHNPWQLDLADVGVGGAAQVSQCGYISPAPSWGLSTSSRSPSLAATPGPNISPELLSQRAASVSPTAQLPAAFAGLHVGCDGSAQGHETPMAREKTATPSAFVSEDAAPVLVYMTQQEYKTWRSGQLNDHATHLQDELYSVVRSVLWGRFTEFREIFYGRCPNGGQYCEPPNLLAFFDLIKPRLKCLPGNLGTICFIVDELIATRNELTALQVPFSWSVPHDYSFLPQELA